MPNLRLNVQRWLGMEADPLDVLLMSGRNRQRSRHIQDPDALYREQVNDVMSGFAADYGGWFALFDAWGSGNEEYTHYLFPGSTAFEPYKRKVARYHTASELDAVSELAREAENRTRALLGLPAIGEGWVSETALYERVKSEFAETAVIQHGCPPWLGRQHFDVWLPHWRIAFEYQGRQHLEPVEFFGGVEGHLSIVERDRRKADLARAEGVPLLYVTEADDVDDVLEQIRQIRSDQVEALYKADADP